MNMLIRDFNEYSLWKVDEKKTSLVPLNWS